MKDLRMPFAAIPLGVAAGFFLAACGEHRAATPELAVEVAVAEEAAGDLQPVITGAPVATAAEPVTLTKGGGVKAEAVRNAMRGLVYEYGSVVIDTEVAPSLVAGPDAVAAQQALAEGHALIEINRRNEALAAMTKAVLLAPDSAEAYEGLGDALTVRRKFTEAGAAFRTGLTFAPNSASLNAKLGDNLVRMDDRAGAVALFRAALAADGEDATTRERLALQLYYMGEHTEAWTEVHAAEALGHQVPPQFRALLAGVHPEPKR